MNKSSFFIFTILSLTVSYSQSMKVIRAADTVIDYSIHYGGNAFNSMISFFGNIAQQPTENKTHNHNYNNCNTYYTHPTSFTPQKIKTDKETLKAQNKIFQDATTSLIEKYGKCENKELIKTILESLQNIKQSIETVKQGEKSQRLNMINKIYSEFSYIPTNKKQDNTAIDQINTFKNMVNKIIEISCSGEDDEILHDSSIIFQEEENKQQSQSDLNNQNNISNNNINSDNNNIENTISYILKQPWDNFIKIVLLQKLSFDKTNFAPIQWQNLQKISTALNKLDAQLPAFTYKRNNKKSQIKISCDLLQGTHEKIQEYKTSEIKSIEIIEEIIKLYEERIQKLNALEINGQDVLKNDIKDWKQKLTINRKMFEVAKEKEKIKQKQNPSLEQYKKELEEYIKLLDTGKQKNLAKKYKKEIKSVCDIEKERIEKEKVKQEIKSYMENDKHLSKEEFDELYKKTNSLENEAQQYQDRLDVQKQQKINRLKNEIMQLSQNTIQLYDLTDINQRVNTYNTYDETIKPSFYEATHTILSTIMFSDQSLKGSNHKFDLNAKQWFNALEFMHSQITQANCNKELLEKFQTIDPQNNIDLLQTYNNENKEKYLGMCRNLARHNLNFTAIHTYDKMKRVYLKSKIRDYEIPIEDINTIYNSYLWLMINKNNETAAKKTLIKVLSTLSYEDIITYSKDDQDLLIEATNHKNDKEYKVIKKWKEKINELYPRKIDQDKKTKLEILIKNNLVALVSRVNDETKKNTYASNDQQVIAEAKELEKNRKLLIDKINGNQKIDDIEKENLKQQINALWKLKGITKYEGKKLLQKLDEITKTEVNNSTVKQTSGQSITGENKQPQNTNYNQQPQPQQKNEKPKSSPIQQTEKQKTNWTWYKPWTWIGSILNTFNWFSWFFSNTSVQ